MRKSIVCSIICLCFFIGSKGSENSLSEFDEDVNQLIHFILEGEMEKAELIVENIQDQNRDVENDQFLNALQYAFESYKMLNSFYGFNSDENWIFELFHKKTNNDVDESHFVNVNHVINYEPNKDFVSIGNYVRSEQNTSTVINLSESIFQKTDEALDALAEIDNAMVKQVKALIYLEKVYAYKLTGALELELYNQLDDQIKEHQRYAVEALTRAGMYWLEYSRIVEAQGENSIWLSRSTLREFKTVYREVLDDIILAKSSI